MSARWVLAGGTVAVLAGCLYLLVQVRATPAEAQGAARPSTGHTASVAPDESPAPRTQPTEVVSSPDPKPAPPPTHPPVADDVNLAPNNAPDAGEPRDKPYRLDSIMAEANRAYDALEYEDARAIAQRVLASKDKIPEHARVRMVRILVSVACNLNEPAEAQKHWVTLPPRDREQMKTRCMRSQITFTDPPT